MTTQGIVPNAKDDTLFFGESATADHAELATDLSQWGDDIADSGLGYLTGNGLRWEVVGPRCIEFTVGARDNTTGTLYSHGTGAHAQSLSVVTGAVRLVINGVDFGPFTLPGVTSTVDQYHIALSSESNPLTTGASDAMRSEVQVWNIDTGDFDLHTFTHDAFDPESATAYFLDDGTGTAIYPEDCYAIRFSGGRFHATTETREDFVAAGVTPTLDYETRIEPLVPDVASGMGAVDECAGPVYALTAADAQANDLILASPLVNAVFSDAPMLAGTFAANPQWLLLDDTFQLHGQYLFMRTVPRTVNSVRCRVHMARTFDARPVGMRLYSMNRPIVAGNQLTALDPGLVVYHTPTVTSMDEHPEVSGYRIGEWFDLGTTTIARSNADRTWLCFGIDIQTSSVNYRIDAIVVEPVLDDDGLGGIGGFA